MFTNASRFSVTNDNNVKFTTDDNSANVYSLATYDFSSDIGEGATSVKIEFDYYIYNGNSAYYRYFTIGDKSLRTGFSKSTYVTSGGMFAFGLKRGKFPGSGSNSNYWSINNGATANTTDNIIGAWAHVEVTINLSAKTSTYKFTSIDGNTDYYSGTDVAYMDGSASTCNQIDFFDCANSVSSYLDNLKITKYVDDSKEATTYTVKYQNANGTDLKDAVVYDTYVGDTYTASLADMATFYSTDTNKKYIYKSGNTSTAAVATATSNVITLVFDEYAKVDYTVTAKNGEETLGTLASGDAYTDGSTTVKWSKYQEYKSQWYSTNTYAKTITEAGNTNVAFTLSDINYFFEMEDLTRSGGAYLTEESASYSNYSRLRISKGSLHYTPALTGGTYLISIPWENGNSSESEVYVYTRSTGGDLSEKLVTFTAPKGSGTFTATITVPDGYSIAFNGNEGSNNNNARMDYMTLTLIPPVSVNVSDAGWATLYTDKALDFSEVAGLTAYTATYEDNKVTLTKVYNVPANTGVVLKGAGDYSIPVIASSSTDKGSLKGSATAATAHDADSDNDMYVLIINGSGKAQFTKATSGSIPAGKAYLPITPSTPSTPNPARMLSVVFDDGDATGITNATAEMKAEDAIFNLAGQRVAQPANGLYIVNGKKVIVK